MNKRSLIAIFLTTTLLLSGCRILRTTVNLSSDSYVPAFNTDNTADYQGNKIYISGITNSAWNTSFWTYYGHENSLINYQVTAALRTYVWDSFIKAFQKIGVIVLRYQDDAPDFYLAFTSITDQEFVFNVNLSRPGEIAFQKRYEIKMPPIRSKDIILLEANAYKLLDAAFAAIVNDPEFKRVFFAKHK